MVTMKINYPSSCLKRNCTFTALVPVEQDPMTKKLTEKAGKKYRTLYLLHGFGGDCNDWILNTRLCQYAEKYGLAVILPSGENRFYLDNDRSEEAYAAFVTEELVEVTRHLLPLSDRREDTLIGGLSMGGYGAVRNGLKYARTFGTIIALSSALITERIAKMQPGETELICGYPYYEYIFGDTAQVLESEANPKLLAERLLKEHQKLPEIYLACGTEDFVLAANRDFHAFLEQKKIRHTYVEEPGSHDWDFWDRQIERAMAWYQKDQPED